jgi:hypothetical protein
MTTERIRVSSSKSYRLGDDTLENIIASLKKELDAGWENLYTDYYYDPISGNRIIVYFLCKYREETDSEYEARMKKLEDKNRREKESRRLQYEKLKLEFSND